MSAVGGKKTPRLLPVMLQLKLLSCFSETYRPLFLKHKKASLYQIYKDFSYSFNKEMLLFTELPCVIPFQNPVCF